MLITHRKAPSQPVAYGPHESNVFDLGKAKSERPYLTCDSRKPFTKRRDFDDLVLAPTP